MSENKLSYPVREFADMADQIEKLASLIDEFLTAKGARESEIKAEIERIKDRIQRFALRYHN